MNNIETVELKKISNNGSDLCYLELGKEIDFEIKRIYYIFSMQVGLKRGYHAHKKLRQVMFCPYGEVEIEFDDGYKKEKYLLDSPNKIIVINQGYWREFEALKQNSVLCIGASDLYDEEDYIRDYGKYINWIKEQN